MKIKGNKGITLIAVVVTAVVLLILSAVTLISLQDINFLEIAKKGKKEHENAANNEQQILSEYDEKISGYGTNKNIWQTMGFTGNAKYGHKYVIADYSSLEDIKTYVGYTYDIVINEDGTITTVEYSIDESGNTGKDGYGSTKTYTSDQCYVYENVISVASWATIEFKENGSMMLEFFSGVYEILE